MSMEAKLIAFVNFVPGNPPTVAKAYNCTVARTAAGDYNVTIGEGGGDASQTMVTATAGTAAGAGAGTARCPSVIQTSDTVKRIQTRDDAGALADAALLSVMVERLPAF